MKWLIMGVVTLALIASCAACRTPEVPPSAPPQYVRIDVSHPVIDTLNVARAIIADAYDLNNGRFVCQTRTYGDGSWISIDVATEKRGGILTFYVREPSSAWGDSVTCYEGVAPVYYPGDNPVGSCTSYALFDVAIERVASGYLWDRIEFYDNGNWNQMYLEFDDGWSCFLAIAKPNKPFTLCERPDYLGDGPGRPKKKFESQPERYDQ